MFWRDGVRGLRSSLWFEEGLADMADEAKLIAVKRAENGTAACRRLRQRGLIPGNVYGHKQAAVPITVPAEGLSAALATGHRLIHLDVDGTPDTVMIRELQWDAFGREMHHVDLLRIDPNEKITLDVPLETRGQAPGTLTGGHLEQPVRTVSVECLVAKIPDKIFVRIGNLQIGGSIYARDLELPDGVKLLTPGDLLILHVVQTKAPLPEELAAAAGAEPELIRKPTEKGEEE
ncbi:MAG: 50S ribosomal protein L25 [Planctomycetaceae bacterium]|nr:50S ribosomal protein L25 [Planctomycetaceae bacterium]